MMKQAEYLNSVESSTLSGPAKKLARELAYGYSPKNMRQRMPTLEVLQDFTCMPIDTIRIAKKELVQKEYLFIEKGEGQAYFYLLYLPQKAFNKRRGTK